VSDRDFIFEDVHLHMQDAEFSKDESTGDDKGE
jgi:hypothetical protein